MKFIPMTRRSRANRAPKQLTKALSNQFSAFEIERLASLGTGVSLDTGARLTIEGQSGKEALVLLSGTADVVRSGEVVASLEAGEIIGEISLLTGAPRNATVIATSPVVVHAMSQREFASLLHQCPRLASRVHKLAFDRVAA